jgi:hypothetical protein
MAKPKTETPMTPQMTPSQSVKNTPMPGLPQLQQQSQRKTISPLESLSGMI